MPFRPQPPHPNPVFGGGVARSAIFFEIHINFLIFSSQRKEKLSRHLLNTLNMVI